ncbi:DEAD/DEAH box helicase family protein [Helicobacter sp.]|uniref:DEAD/DEAH box helicase n=1 Tax=Helicobacter sp. TaxID=218 RepID=UPI0025C57B3F|nr:DEAD/DEAH box helicase family protein [Helicobacter sp.]MCI5968925.1 DEAD/DEAH box helicase family protein [Helicobacter sp.]
MRLKHYQASVIQDFQRYLEILKTSPYAMGKFTNLHSVWQEFYTHKEGYKPYQNTINGIPKVCYKIPTGGGKTLLALHSITTYYKNMESKSSGIVVWIVPNEAILTQTLANLRDKSHPYYHALSAYFNNAILVFDKEQLINGEGFNEHSVENHLCVCVIMADSLKEAKSKRKIYEENSNLDTFESKLLENETLSLFNVLKAYRPLMILDESHRATSELSLELQEGLNPKFILELSATPKERTNILTLIPAWQLKEENMIKLPIIVYKLESEDSLINKAIDLQKGLEKEAISNGENFRPLVLIQAQSKNEEKTEKQIKENLEHFNIIKDKLISYGVEANQIAIKTAKINEIKNVDLKAITCPIKFIITINALKEGWDCPSAYVLASLSHKSNKTDIEQIVGRILRQPNARKSSQSSLNCSYVLSYSDKFDAAISEIQTGLQGAGFSKNDYRIQEDLQKISQDFSKKQFTLQNPNPSLFSNTQIQENKTQQATQTTIETTKEIPHTPENSQNNDSIQELKEISQIAQAQQQKEIEMKKHENQLKIKENFKEFIGKSFGYFAIKIPNRITPIKLAKENLYEGFNLSKSDSNIDFGASQNVKEIGINQDGSLYTDLITQAKLEQLERELSSKSGEERIDLVAQKITYIITDTKKFPSYNAIQDYVKRALIGIQIEAHTLAHFATKIGEKIQDLLDKHAKEQFFKKCENDSIVVTDDTNSFKIPEYIDKDSQAITTSSKSLFSACRLNKFEKEAIEKIASYDNVVCFYRNTEKKDFCFNGFLNFYPDFIVWTKKSVIFIETKGDFLSEQNAINKNLIAEEWIKNANKNSDKNFKFFLIFENKDLEQSYNLDGFLAQLSDL